MKYLFFLSIIFLFYGAYLFIINSNFNDSTKIETQINDRALQNRDIEQKVIDLTSLSKRISKKNIYLKLGSIKNNNFLNQIDNPLAYQEMLNFEEAFGDIIKGDLLNINLFEENFRREIKSITKKNKNKIITTKAGEDENESFIVIGKEMSFGKIHINNKVFLLKKNLRQNYIVDTANVEMVIPQFGDDYLINEN